MEAMPNRIICALKATALELQKARTNTMKLPPRHHLRLPQFSCASSLMSALCSLFSLLPKSPPLILHPPSSPTSNPRPNFIPRASSPNSNPKPNSTSNSPNLPQERSSFAVATGEIFLGLASLLINNRAESEARVGPVVSGDEVFNGEFRDRVANNQSVVWEQREQDVEAEKDRRTVTSPGFSFSAAGLLFPYHLGVARLLLEKGYIKETTPLAGSSAGAIVCAVIASGNTMDEALQLTKHLADNCRTKGTAFRLGAVLRDVLQEFLPEDAHIRSNGRIRVAVTQLGWRPRGLLVDQFDSKEDLINALFTSSFIPGYLAPRPATIFRNRLCIDGGLTLFMPPTSASETVRICAFPANRIGIQGIGISPDCSPENRASPRQLFNWALEPAEEYILDKLYELGYLDAAVWAEQNPVDSTARDEDA